MIIRHPEKEEAIINLRCDSSCRCHRGKWYPELGDHCALCGCIKTEEAFNAWRAKYGATIKDQIAAQREEAGQAQQTENNGNKSQQ